MTIDKIYNELINLKYERKSSYDKRPYTTEVVNEDAREVFRVALADALSDQLNEYKSKIATLEAKVFAYEAILKNSNFAMAVVDSDIKKSEDADNE
jgi:hypothetical protein